MIETAASRLLLTQAHVLENLRQRSKEQGRIRAETSRSNSSALIAIGMNASLPD